MDCLVITRCSPASTGPPPPARCEWCFAAHPNPSVLCQTWLRENYDAVETLLVSIPGEGVGVIAILCGTGGRAPSGSCPCRGGAPKRPCVGLATHGRVPLGRELGLPDPPMCPITRLPLQVSKNLLARNPPLPHPCPCADTFQWDRCTSWAGPQGYPAMRG